jgi:hypothetical protein
MHGSVLRALIFEFFPVEKAIPPWAVSAGIVFKQLN